MTADPIPELRRVLTDDVSSDLALRFRALFSLKHSAAEGSNAAVDAIAAAFSSPSALLKHELAYCLGQSKNLHAVPYLQAVLSDESEDAMVRHEAGEALGALNHAPSLPLLRKYASDPAPEVAQTCELAIARIEWEMSPTRPSEKLQASAYASIDPAPPLETDDGDNYAKLTQQLNDQSLPLFQRYRAMFRLRDLGTHEAIDALALGLDDPSALFRHEIAFVFGQLSDPHSIPALVNCAGNKSEASMVRHEAVEALGSIADPRVDAFLHEYAKDEERVVRESAEVALDMAKFERSGELEYALVSGTA